MASRINRAVELLAQDQAIYYVGQHTGHVLSFAQGRADAHTWADYINIGMEHGAFDMAGLAEYLRGLLEAGPTNSDHRTPAVIVEAPVRGTDAAGVSSNTWQFRQILARGVHGLLLCQAESAEAVGLFVAAAILAACRPRHSGSGVAAAALKPPPRPFGAYLRQNTWNAATPGRSMRPANCCSA